jgi:phage terminase large subunit-like protein
MSDIIETKEIDHKVSVTGRSIVKLTLDQWLDGVDYNELSDGSYVPEEFSLVFMNLVKLINGAEGESHKTPAVHLKMLDKLSSKSTQVANLCFRGAAKTTLFFEYLAPILAIFQYLPNFGALDSMIYVSDSMDNGVKSARKNLEFRYENSAFLQEWLPDAHFTDNYIEFTNKDGKRFGIKMFGAKALSLDSRLYLASGGTTTIGECQIGDLIMGADGKPTRISQKSEVFHKPMYELVLDDGRKLKVSEDHLNQVHVKKFQSARTFSRPTYEEKTLTTLELLEEPMYAIDPNGSQRPLLWVENTRPIEWPENTDLLLDPYTAGVLIGDGSMNRKASGASSPIVLTGHENDWPTLERGIPYAFGKIWRDNRHPQTISRTVLGISQFVSMHGLDCHGRDKRVPGEFLYGSISQRLALLQGLMDTDGTCSKDGKPSFCSASKGLVEDVMWLVRSLGGTARWVSKGNERAYQCAVRLNMPLFRLQRKLERQRPLRSDKVAIVAINVIADEPSQCIAVDNDEHQFAAEDFFRTHNTGIRGTKIFGKRPKLAVLDDLISDDDAKSKASMQSISDTVHKGINYALDPTRRKTIFNGTPFNQQDILITAVESGAWDVNVWPVCERFPCTREEFIGAWEDRFSFDFVMEQYENAVLEGKVEGFMQELMLRISSDEERLIQDAEIREYSRIQLLEKRSQYNFYITTDFATSDKQTADYSVISVWAYNANGDWFWVDGYCERATAEKPVNELFRLVQLYQPQSVGIEISGQQRAFVKWLQSEMMTRNIWFNFASSQKSGEPGIMPVTNKLTRFNLVVPLFKAGKMYFPSEWKTSKVLSYFYGQIRMATKNGLKGKDDCLDTISMLMYLNAWKPSEQAHPMQGHNGGPEWDEDEDRGPEPSSLDSYLV